MIRELIFKFFFYFGTIIICLFFIPALVLPQKIDLIGGKILGYWIKFCLNFFLSVKVKINGLENIPKESPFFIACLHQSLFETFYLQAIFNFPIFILKKELLKIPIFGWYLKKIGSIAIERNKVSRQNIDFLDRVKFSVSKYNRPLVIFPQGTRHDFNERPQFKKGVSRIYEQLKIKCLPIAINSGSVWPKNGRLNKNKTLTISILKPIETGKDSKIFLESLQKIIYEELDNLSNLSSA